MALDFFQIVEGALGIPAEVGIVILALATTIVFYAKDFRIGLMSSFIVSALVYLLLYVSNRDTTFALTIMLIFVVLLALSIYLTAKRSENPFLIR